MSKIDILALYNMWMTPNNLCLKTLTETTSFKL